MNGSTFGFPIPGTSLTHSQPAPPPLQSELQLHGAPPLSSCGSWVLPSPQRPELQLHGVQPSDLEVSNSASFPWTLSSSSGAASCSSHPLYLAVSFLLFQSSNTSFTTFLHWILKIIKSGFHLLNRSLPNKPSKPMQVSSTQANQSLKVSSAKIKYSPSNLSHNPWLRLCTEGLQTPLESSWTVTLQSLVGTRAHFSIKTKTLTTPPHSVCKWLNLG